MEHSDASQKPQPARERVKWPRMSSNMEWKQLDEDLDKILEVALAGPVEKKINTLTSIIYNLAREHFGIEERKIASMKEKELNRKEKMKHRRKEIRTLTKQFKKATDQEGLTDLTAGL